MHPNPAFRSDDRALFAELLDLSGFGMVFGAGPDGLRVAHTPLLPVGDGAVRFHLARGNALTRDLDGATALVVVNGPDAYVSPRWYSDPDQVPTWNYAALELEGTVRRLDESELAELLKALSARHEARIVAGTAWTMDKLSAANRRRLMTGIFGYELVIRSWRPTLKLSQNKAAPERARVIQGMEAAGQRAMAALMRALPA